MTRIWTRSTGVVLSLLLVSACGGSKEEQAARDFEQGAEQLRKAAESSSGNAEDMAKGFEAMAKGLTAMAGGDPNERPVDPVGFRDLMALFPEQMSGWDRSKPTGQRMSAPVNFSEAEVRFTKGQSQLVLKITDSGLNQMLFAPFAMFLTSGYERETESGYEKSVKVAEYPGWEKWNATGKDGELNAIVSRRFLVQVEARNVDDPKAMYDLIDATNLRKLAELK